MKLRSLWLWYFPLLFLPNLGYGIKTANGSLQLSDFLIGPYLIFLLFALPHGKKLNIGRITPFLGLFVVWALISTITMPARYHYVGDGPLTFSLLKIAKLCLYGVAGILTARALSDEHSRRLFDWSLLLAGVVTGVSLLTLGSGQGPNATDTGQTYSASNGISAMLAILVCYLAARYLTGHDSLRWRQFARIGFMVIAAGFFLSDGRGGWVAALAGFAYIFVRLGFKRQVVTFGVCAAIFIWFFYATQPDFQKQVDMTVFPQRFPQNTTDVGGVDNGARFETWAHEAPKLLDDPFLGRGFFHRGGNSGLFSTGSHNFWLQMFLETGIIGGVLVIAAVAATWKQATVMALNRPLADLPFKAAVVAGIVGGMGGEYFYGGIILFALFAVYAPLGSMTRQDAVEAMGEPEHAPQAHLQPVAARNTDGWTAPAAPSVHWG